MRFRRPRKSRQRECLSGSHLRTHVASDATEPTGAFTSDLDPSPFVFDAPGTPHVGYLYDDRKTGLTVEYVGETDDAILVFAEIAEATRRGRCILATRDDVGADRRLELVHFAADDFGSPE